MRFQRWHNEQGFLPALSIQQPFAEAILAGKKSIELRTWATNYRGRVLLHAGKRWYWQNLGLAPADAYSASQTFAERQGLALPIDAYPRGALVGIARLTNCARFTTQTWRQYRDRHRSPGEHHDNIIGWWLADVERFAEPIPWSGALGLFAVRLQIAGIREREPGRFELDPDVRREPLVAAGAAKPESEWSSLWDGIL